MGINKIILTGATGFLGSHLLEAFLDENFSITIVKRTFSNTDRISHLIDRINIFDVDQQPLDLLFNSFGPFDAIVHTATNYGRKGESTSEILHDNLLFPLKLIETATKYNKFVFFNTATILNPLVNAYSLSKSQLENWGKFYFLNKKIGFVNIKIDHIYGPNDDKSKFTTFIFDNLIQNKPFIELTLGNQKRDFIYISDVVNAFLHIIKSQNNIIFKEYEIGTGRAVTIKYFVELAKKITSSKTYLVFGAKQYRNMETMFSQAQIKELQNIGWNPKISLEEGIAKCLESYQI